MGICLVEIDGNGVVFRPLVLRMVSLLWWICLLSVLHCGCGLFFAVVFGHVEGSYRIRLGVWKVFVSLCEVRGWLEVWTPYLPRCR